VSVINYSERVIDFKIVYYGPGLAGKTANLQYVHRCLPHANRGRMISLAAGDDRTKFAAPLNAAESGPAWTPPS